MWVRDSSTIGVCGFEQDSAADGFPGDPSRGAFAGEIFAQDWLQIFPGLADDPGNVHFKRDSSNILNRKRRNHSHRHSLSHHA